VERWSKLVRHGGQIVSVAHKLRRGGSWPYDRSFVIVGSAGLVIALSSSASTNPWWKATLPEPPEVSPLIAKRCHLYGKSRRYPVAFFVVQ
jgi:hypothetical protein